MGAEVTVKRTVSAVIMLGLFFASVLAEPILWLFPLLVLGFGCLCLYELGQLIALRTERFPFLLCDAFLVLLLVDGYWAGLRHGFHVLTLCLLALLAWRVLLSDAKGVAPQIGAAFLATAYIGLPMAMAVAMVQLRDGDGNRIGQYHLIFQIAVLFGGDTAAYFVGRNWGKRPFFPRLSPKKTLEGAVASVVVSVLLALVLTCAVPGLRECYGWVHGLALGLLLGVAAPLGDLAESLFKRDVGRKDSGNLLQGHGGFLDVFDSLLFGIPVQYCYIQLVLENL